LGICFFERQQLGAILVVLFLFDDVFASNFFWTPALRRWISHENKITSEEDCPRGFAPMP